MGVSCVGKVRKYEQKKVENKSNTLSSEMHSQEEAVLHKPEPPLPALRPSRHSPAPRHPLAPPALPSHREYRYQEYLSFRSQPLFSPSPPPPPQDLTCPQWRVCSTLQAQEWGLRGLAVGSSNCSFVLLGSAGNEGAAITGNKGQEGWVPERVVILSAKSIGEELEVASRCVEVGSLEELQSAVAEAGANLIQAQPFTTPFLSGLLFSQQDPHPRHEWLTTLLRLNTPLSDKPFHLVLYPNRSTAKGKSLPSHVQLATYFQISNWVHYLFGSVWQIEPESLAQHVSQNNFDAYLSVQLLRCLIDSHEDAWLKSQIPPEDINRSRITLIHQFLLMEQELMWQIYFLGRCFFLLSGMPREAIEERLGQLMRAAVQQTCMIADGLFLEFGLEINEKQHPFRNQSHCFMKYRASHPHAMPKLIPKLTYKLPTAIVVKLHSALQQISSQHATIRPEQIDELNQALLRSIEEEKEGLQVGQWEGGERLVRQLLEDYLIRINLAKYYFQVIEGSLSEPHWKELVELVERAEMLSGQSLLVFFTLGALTTSALKQTTDRTALEQSYFLKSLQLAHRLYGDPRATRHGLPLHPEQAWQLIILENFSPLFSNLPSEKKELHFLTNMLDCLREDLKQLPHLSPPCLTELAYRDNLRAVAQFLPLRRCSGWMVRRREVWDYEDSRSNFSESQSSSGSKRTSRASQRIGESEFSLRAGAATVVKWGQGVAGAPQVFPALKNKQVIALQSGNYHSVFLTEDGLFGWGENHAQQLGTHNPQPIYLKETVCLLATPVDRARDSFHLSCGNEHTALLLNGLLHMWGQTEGGILAGHGHRFDAVSCGGLHTLGIRDGLVYSWGRGEGGQLGLPLLTLKQKKREETTEFYQDVPVHLKTISSFAIKVACGDAHSLVLTVDGKVMVFGFCYQGQLGLGLTGESESFQVWEPVEQGFFKERVVDLWAGPTFSFFKTEKEEVFSCGMNDCLQLGIDRVMKVFQKKKFLHRTLDHPRRRLGEQEFSRPRRLNLFNPHQRLRLLRLECGENHCLALADYMGQETMVTGWGLNKHFQIDAQLSENTAPRTLDALFALPVQHLCCGATYSLAVIGAHVLTRNEVIAQLEVGVGGAGRVWLPL